MLQSLLCPKIVAVVGASQQPGKVGHEVLANLINSGFQGTIVPVNPRADEVLGRRCYHRLTEYKGKISGDEIKFTVEQNMGGGMGGPMGGAPQPQEIVAKRMSP